MMARSRKRARGPAPHLGLAGIAFLLSATAAFGSVSTELGMVEPSYQVGEFALRRASEAFIENLGQWDAAVEFLASTPSANVWITNSGAVYEFTQTEPGTLAVRNPLDKFMRGGGGTRRHAIQMQFENSNGAALQGSTLIPGRYNMFVGSVSKRWTSNIRRFGEVKIDRLYPGVSARWYFDQGLPRYDLVIARGADPGQIALKFVGAEGISIDGDKLVLATSLGNAEMRGLFAFQKVNGQIRQVPCKFRLDNALIKFDVGNYNQNYPLIIDPLLVGSFLGGFMVQEANSVALDALGNVVVAGAAPPTEFPTKVGVQDRRHVDKDAFVAKLNSDTGQLVYCTILGGTQLDVASSANVDSSGSVALCGYTSSSDLPTGARVFGRQAKGGGDAFVARLSADGARLFYCSYLGGSGSDYANSVVISPSGNTVICGETRSPDFLSTASGFHSGSGQGGAFVSCLDPTGSNLLFGAMFALGIGTAANGAVLDTSGNVYVCGYTDSREFPTTNGAFAKVYGGGLRDGFLAKLSSNGQALLFGTYLGGESGDTANAVALGPAGNAVVCGTTSSTSFPTSPGAFSRIHAGGIYDAFVAKVGSNDGTLVYAAYLGGEDEDRADGIVVDRNGTASVCGTTRSVNFPTTDNGLDLTLDGSQDGFLAQISGDGTKLGYSTLLGRASVDGTNGIAVGRSGSLLVSGFSRTAVLENTGLWGGTWPTWEQDAYFAKLSLLNKSRMERLLLEKSPLPGGFGVRTLAVLDIPAPRGGVRVNLQSDHPQLVRVPSMLFIPEGSSIGAFFVETDSVRLPTKAIITASTEGVVRRAVLALTPGGLTTVQVKPGTIDSGKAATGRVVLTGRAQSARRVLLSSSTLAVGVPNSVLVRPNEISATFAIKAALVNRTTVATIRARLGTVTRAASITIKPY